MVVVLVVVMVVVVLLLLLALLLHHLFLLLFLSFFFFFYFFFVVVCFISKLQKTAREAVVKRSGRFARFSAFSFILTEIAYSCVATTPLPVACAALGHQAAYTQLN